MAAGDIGPDEGVTSAETVLIEPADSLVISPAPPREMPTVTTPEDVEESAAGDENAAGGEAAVDDVAAADGGEPVAGNAAKAPEEDSADAPEPRRRTSKKR